MSRLRPMFGLAQVMAPRTLAFALMGLMPASLVHAITVWVEGGVEQVAATGDGSFGGCMAELDIELADAGLDCSGSWVTFGCAGDDADSEEPGRVFEAMRSAVVADRSVAMRVTDESERDGYCHASRIKIQDEPHVDVDSDADGVLDLDDDVPLDASETVDTDDDGIGNNADPDDDNDGVADADDDYPLDPNEAFDTCPQNPDYNCEAVLAALVDFRDVEEAERLFSRDEIVDLLSHNNDSLKRFIWHTSRNLVRVTFDVLDWVTVDKNRSDYPLDYDSAVVVVQDAVSAISHHADLGQYDKLLLFIYPLEQGSPFCQAYLGPVRWNTPNGAFDLGAAWLSGVDMNCVFKGRIAHEYGHTFGFGHSLALWCHTKTGIPVSTIDPTDRDSCRIVDECRNEDCTEWGEGDSWISLNSDPDMLGGDSVRHYEDYFPLVLQAVWQARAGWLTEEQIVTTTGSHWITTLESLSPTAKAIRIRLGHDHADGVQEYWLETRKPLPDTSVYLDSSGSVKYFEVESCSLAVRMTIPNRYDDGRFIGLGRGYTDTYRFVWLQGRTARQPGDDDTYRGVRDGEPFWDPYRGVRFELAECVERDNEVAVRVDVSRSELRAEPEVVAVLRGGMAEVSVTNTGAQPVSIGQPSFGGRHAEAFTLGEEDCGGTQLRPGQSCRIKVESSAVSESVGFLQIPNDDDLAPELTVSLVAQLESSRAARMVPLHAEPHVGR